MEDVMGEYFLRTICDCSKPRAHEDYFKYLNNTSGYISDYRKITSGSRKHVKGISGRAGNALENSEMPSKKRYFERMQETLRWLKDNSEFYHYYFRDYYVCPSCGASIFDRYTKEEMGDWLVISCSACGTEIKKYYSPKFV
jgi:ribosomal protein L37AE/L43A